MFDEHGLITSFETANQYNKMLFNLFTFILQMKPFSIIEELNIVKISFFIKKYKKNIIDLIIGNDQYKIKALKPEYKFDFVKIMVGIGKGIWQRKQDLLININK